MSFANAFKKAGLINEEEHRRAEDESRERARTQERASQDATTVASLAVFNEVHTVPEFIEKARHLLIEDPRRLKAVRAEAKRFIHEEGGRKLQTSLSQLAGRLRTASGNAALERAAIEELLEA